MILIIDNYDSFTYNLVDYFEQIGCEVVVRKNDSDLQEIDNLTFDGIVISPGPETPIKAGITNLVIEKYYNQVPMLGICLGFQALGEFFGCKLVKSPYPKHGKISMIKTEFCPIYSQIPSTFNVTRYHSLILTNISKDLKITATSVDDNSVMSFHHKTLPIWGIQYHPEAVLTEYGINILRNWVTFNKLVQSN